MSCRSRLRPARRCCIVQRRCTARIAACKIQGFSCAMAPRGGQADLAGAAGLQAAGRMPAMQLRAVVGSWTRAGRLYGRRSPQLGSSALSLR